MIPIPYNNNGPQYWQYETSGRLAAAVKAYLRPYSEVMVLPSIELNEEHLSNLRIYLLHWASAPCYRENPFADAEHMSALDALIESVKAIDCRKAIDDWLDDALKLGIDPL